MSETVTMTLTEFLLARIAEDEGTALYAQTRDDLQPEDWGGWWFGHHQHYSRYSPARVIAECEAKRRIVELHESWPVMVETEPEFTASPDGADSIAMQMSQRIAWLTTKEYRARFGDEPPSSPILRALAAIYADHPDYRDEWKP